MTIILPSNHSIEYEIHSSISPFTENETTPTKYHKSLEISFQIII